MRKIYTITVLGCISTQSTQVLSMQGRIRKCWKEGPNFQILDPVLRTPSKTKFPMNAFSGCYNTSRLNLQQKKKLIHISRSKYNVWLNWAKAKIVHGYSVNLLKWLRTKQCCQKGGKGGGGGRRIPPLNPPLLYFIIRSDSRKNI